MAVEAAPATAVDDLRGFIRTVEEWGDLRIIEGAHWKHEIGALTELGARAKDMKLLLFDRIPDYPPGYRVLTNMISERRLALSLRLPTDARGLDLVAAYRKKMRTVDMRPPQFVSDGPVFENAQQGDNVNILAFPAPLWHEKDGGRYIGTSVLIITKDPDSDWVNVGTYRVQVQDERTVTVFIEPGKHGSIIRSRWWARGQACPMAICCGQHPALSVVASYATRHGESEYDLAGGWIEEPISVVRAPLTGLPIPAFGELVLEGEMPPPEVETRAEGPFGEWPGYYASSTRPEPIMRVQAVYHRDNPIITGSPPLKPTYPGIHANTIRQAAAVWDQMEGAGVSGIRGVWMMEGGGSRFATVVSITQMHSGHAKMAGLVASGCRAGAFLGRMVIVVDEDIDITDPREVIWAMATRWDPKTQSDILDGTWTGYIDPMLPPEKREEHDLTNSRIIVYACRPYAWKGDFPAVSTLSPELKAQVLDKWLGRLDFLQDAPS